MTTMGGVNTPSKKNISQSINLLGLSFAYKGLSLLNLLLKLGLKGFKWLKWNVSEYMWRIDVKIRYLKFNPRPSDIFLVTYPRSGTTWTQMILYQLVTGGAMNFERLSDVSPWIEDPETPGATYDHYPAPRIIKSHAPYNQFPQWPGKYIYVIRNGPDVAVSFYHLFCAYYDYQGSFDQFFDTIFMSNKEWGGWFSHVAGWYKHKDNPNILILEYEALKQDLEGCLNKIIAFCNLNVEAERIPLILEKCSFAFMREHEEKFLPFKNKTPNKNFIRQGKVGKGAAYLNPQQQARFKREFETHLGQSGLNFSVTVER